MSLLLTKYNLQTYRETFKNLETEKQSAEDKKLEIETLITVTEAALEKGKSDNVEKEKALSDVQKKLNSLVTGLGEKENERNRNEAEAWSEKRF